MARKKNSWWLIILAWSWFFGSACIGRTLKNQILGTVDQTIITLRDLQIEEILSELIDHDRVKEKPDMEWTREQMEHVRDAVIKKILIRSYLLKISEVIIVGESEKKKYQSQFMRIFGTEEKITQYWKKFSMEPEEVQQWIQEHFQTTVFMEKYLVLPVISDEQVKSYYEKEKNNRFLGKPFEKIKEIAKANLHKESLEKEFDHWLKKEMKRTKIQLIPLPEKS